MISLKVKAGSWTLLRIRLEHIWIVASNVNLVVVLFLSAKVDFDQLQRLLVDFWILVDLKSFQLLET